MANNLVPGCGHNGIQRAMWHTGNPCLLEVSCREKCCYPVTPGVSQYKQNSFVFLDMSLDEPALVQITPDNIDTVDCKFVYFSPKCVDPVDYCTEREVWWNFTIDCNCVCWPEDADEAFQAAVWKLAVYNKIKCREGSC